MCQVSLVVKYIIKGTFLVYPLCIQFQIDNETHCGHHAY